MSARRGVMKTGTGFLAGLASVALLAALAPGCEDTQDLLAPKDGTIAVTANPGRVVLDPNDADAARDPDTGALIGFSGLTVQVFDKDGRVVPDVVVQLSSEGGVLGSASVPGAPPTDLTTDDNGRAFDSIQVSDQDPSSVKVTARSGTLSGTGTVSVEVVGCTNTSPTANAGSDQTVDGEEDPSTVIVDGTASTDTETPEADLRFSWECGNGTSPYADPDDEDSFPAVAACDYESSATEDKVYTATLTVTDTGNTGTPGVCVKSATDTVKITVKKRTSSGIAR
jgi:hypothetical protein